MAPLSPPFLFEKSEWVVRGERRRRTHRLVMILFGAQSISVEQLSYVSALMSFYFRSFLKIEEGWREGHIICISQCI